MRENQGIFERLFSNNPAVARILDHLMLFKDFPYDMKNMKRIYEMEESEIMKALQPLFEVGLVKPVINRETGETDYQYANTNMAKRLAEFTDEVIQWNLTQLGWTIEDQEELDSL